MFAFLSELNGLPSNPINKRSLCKLWFANIKVKIFTIVNHLLRYLNSVVSWNLQEESSSNCWRRELLKELKERFTGVSKNFQQHAFQLNQLDGSQLKFALNFRVWSLKITSKFWRIFLMKILLCKRHKTLMRIIMRLSLWENLCFSSTKKNFWKTFWRC